MSASSSNNRQAITLRGSSQVVAEYFGFAINTILYQRGVYDPDSFTTVRKYGLRMFVTTDPRLAEYMKNILKQLQGWLTNGFVRKLVLTLQSVDTMETIERWVFNIETNTQALLHPDKVEPDRDLKQVQKEIAAVMRQISISMTYLPIIDEPSTFDILIYTKDDVDIPQDWELSDPKFVPKANEVRFRSFSTFFHTVDTSVTYKADE